MGRLDWFLYDYAMVGVGTSIAFYLETLDRPTYKSILVLGVEDPWAGKRGPGIVNHTQHMIAHFNSMPQFSKTMVNRTAFADSNKKVIETEVARNGSWVKKEVKRIRHNLFPHMVWLGDCFWLDTHDVTYFARKVVIGTGAGAHRRPEEVEGLPPDRAIDMDTFMREIDYRDSNGRSIIVLGPNAAIDAVDEAVARRYVVNWLVRGSEKRTPIPLLDTAHQVNAEKAAKNVRRYEGALTCRMNGAKVRVEFQEIVTGLKSDKLAAFGGGKVSSGMRTSFLEADLIVYGIGQEATQAPAYKMLSEELRSQLEPIYDKNQRLGQVYQSVLGLQLQGTDSKNGLEIVGAAAYQMAVAAKVPHTYLQNLAKEIAELRLMLLDDTYNFNYFADMHNWFTQDNFITKLAENAAILLQDLISPLFGAETQGNKAKALAHLIKHYLEAATALRDVTVAQSMDAVTKTMTTSVVSGQQIGAIIGSTTSHNAFVHHDGEDRIFLNVNRDDRTMLRIYIDVHYPYVSDEDAERWIDTVIKNRKDKKTQGYGLTDQDSKLLLQQLSANNERVKRLVKI